MKQKVFFGSLLMAGLIVATGNEVFAQKKDDPAAKGPQTCEELLAKPATAEQLKAASEESRKQYNAQLKECTEAVAKNTGIKNANEVVNRTLKEGSAALDKKDYETAVAKFDEGYNASPDYWGSATVMLRNKAIALRSRGVDKFNAAVKNPDKAARAAGIADAGKDFQGAVDALQKAADVFGKSTAPTDAAQAKNFNDGKAAVIADRAESYRLLVKADSSKATDGVKAYEDYLAIETDPAKKSKAQFTAADLALESGNSDLAVTEFQKILSTEPNNSKAMYKLGIALIAQGSGETPDKAKVQEGVNYLQKFADSAPDADPDKEYAKATIEAMKAENNVTPVKGGAKTGGKRKN